MPTVAELKGLIEAQEEGETLVLTGQSLNSTSIQALFQAQLPDGTLVISDYEVTEGSDWVQVDGRTNYRTAVGASVVAKFIALADGVEAVITIDPSLQNGATVTWKLSQSFPALDNTFLAQAVWSEPTFTLASSPQGLSFQGKLPLPDELEPALWLLNGSTEVGLSGGIALNSGLPVMTLTALAFQNVALGFLTLSIELQLRTRALPAGSQSRAVAELALVSEIQFGEGDEAKDITITARLPYGSPGLLSFVADLDDISFSDLAELSGLVNDADLSQIPTAIELADALKLAQLSFIVSPSDEDLVSVSLEVHSTEPWVIVEDILEIELVRIRFIVYDLSGTKDVHVILWGEVGVGGVLVNASLSLPGEIVTASLAPGSTISLTDFLEPILPDAGLPDLTITALEMASNHVTGAYSFSFAIIDDWQIELRPSVSLAITELSMSIDCPGSGQSTTGQIFAAWTVAGQKILLAATGGEAQGWQLTGDTIEGQQISIHTLIQELAGTFGIAGSLPEPLATVTIDSLHVSFNTASRDFTFLCGADFLVEDKAARISLSIALDREANGGYSRAFGGHLTIGSLEFDLRFLTDAQAGETSNDYFLATYSHTGSPQSQNIKSLASAVSSNLAAFIPGELAVDLDDVLFAYSKESDSTAFLFGLDIDVTNISLSHLPLVGHLLPADQRIDLRSLRVLVASDIIETGRLGQFNSLLPSGVPPLPIEEALSQGVTVSATIDFGGTTRSLALPASAAGTAPSTAPSAESPDVTAGGSAKWLIVQKSFGPVHFNRIGVQYENAVLTFLLDAALSAAGLTLSLDGLGFGSPLSQFQPTFTLRGLGLDYAKGPLAISGAFLRTPRTGAQTSDTYDGGALMKTEDFTLSALGSYAEVQGHPSLFVYALLDEPLGGPTFFFVTGLAAGFGFNRALNIPPVSQLAQFPLIAAAVTPSSAPAGTMAMLQTLEQQNAIPPKVGEIFLAVGVKFTSFKLIDSFALLSVAFGDELEIDVSGLSTLIAPAPETGKPPLAEVQLALSAKYRPEQGFLAVTGQLTPASFIFSRDCHLTGGYAFYSWFSGPHAGDFVSTLGGYHPSFSPPPHYPLVPRLGISWQVDEHLSVKGDAYFALTASALMAGGSLQILWQDGALSAWGALSADFLVAWKPFHYEADVSIEMGARYHSISVDVGVDLHLWGPEFSGKAHVHLDIISFDISFGSRASSVLFPISWNRDDTSFKQSFLPADDAVCSVTIAGGLIRSSGDVWIVQAKDLRLTTSSIIPSKTAKSGETELTHGGTGNLRVAPMTLVTGGVSHGGSLTSKHVLSITRAGSAVDDDFQYTPILRRVPMALWGPSMQPNLSQSQLVEGALTGFTITPLRPPTAGATQAVNRSALRYDAVTVSRAYEWHPPLAAFHPSTQSDPERRQEIQDKLASASVSDSRRYLLVEALGLDPGLVALNPATLAAAFVIPPQIKT